MVAALPFRWVRSSLLSNSLLLVILLAPFLWWAEVGNQSVVKWFGVYAIALVALPLAYRGGLRHHMPALSLLALSAVSLVWSPDPQRGALIWLNMAALYLVFLVIWNTDIEIPWAGLSVVALALIFILPQAGFVNENFLSHFLILTVPFCMTKRSWPLAAIVVGFLLFRGSDEGLLVLGLAYIYLCYRVYHCAGFYYLLLMILVPINAALFITPDLTPLWVSVMDRAELWVNSLRVFAEYPLGTGLGGFDYHYAEHDEFHRLFFDNNLLGRKLQLFALAAHNEWLQALVVLGPFGLLLSGWFVYSVWPSDFRLRSAVVIALTIGIVNFPYQLPASALLVCFIAALSARSLREYSPQASRTTAPRSI